MKKKKFRFQRKNYTLTMRILGLVLLITGLLIITYSVFAALGLIYAGVMYLVRKFDFLMYDNSFKLYPRNKPTYFENIQSIRFESDCIVLSMLNDKEILINNKFDEADWVKLNDRFKRVLIEKTEVK